MHKSVLLACINIAAVLHLVTAINSVGSPCVDNSTCTGPYEFCQPYTWVLGGCEPSKGACMCKPGYTNGQYDYWASQSSYDCQLLKLLSLGDACTNSYNELILPENAECDRTTTNKVVCSSGFNVAGSGCVLAGIADLNKDCSSSSCGTGFYCYTNTCKCRLQYEKYDPNSGGCISKDFGDDCSEDADCRGTAKEWKGYSYNSASCGLDKNCGCSDTAKKTTVAWFDWNTSILKTKAICVSNDVKAEATNGTECYTDPIYNSEGTSMAICASDHVCLQCSAGSNYGICRKIVAGATMPLSNTVNRPVPVVSGLPSASSGGASSSISITLPNGWTAQDLITAQAVNATSVGTLRQCNNIDKKCSLNEVCTMPVQCARGYCSCPFVVDSGGACVTTTSTTTTTAASITTTTSTPSTTSTVKTTTTSTTTMAVALLKKYYNDTCTADSECTRVGLGVAGALGWNGYLVCKVTTGSQKYCICSENKYIWRPSAQQCQPRDYDDPCVSDTDCDNGLYVVSGVSGQKCSNYKCGCNLGYTAVKAATLWASWGATIPNYVQQPDINRYFCVLSSVTQTATSGGTCTLKVLPNTNKATRICPSDQVCLGCPLDMAINSDVQYQYGSCTKFNFPNAAGADAKKNSGGNGASMAATSSLFNLSFALSFAYFRSALLSLSTKI